MPARALSSATVSFGLVSIPVKLYSTSESSSQISFNLVHKDCGTRLKQQYICPDHNVVVDREHMDKGYEFAKGQYVILSEEEIKNLQEVPSHSIDLVEFISVDLVDPIFFDKAYFLGPDKGGERAYKLLSTALERAGLVGLARYAARGKQYLVAVRPYREGLLMQQLHYAQTVRDFAEVPIKDSPPSSEAELKLAMQLIDHAKSEAFEPGKFKDDVYERMSAQIEEKIAGKEIVAPAAEGPTAQIIDLMEALKKSLGAEGASSTKRTKAKDSGSSEVKKSRAKAK